MNKTSLLSVAFALGCILLLIVSCKTEKIELTDKTPAIRPLTARESQTVSSSNNFAFDIFEKLGEKDKDKNIFISPLSLSMALTMAYNGANTTTKDAISRTLGFTPATDEDINQSFKSLTELLHDTDKAIVFKSANSIWHTDKIMLQKDFIAANKQYFDARVQGLNFIDPASKDIINGWVREKTAGKISEIVESIHPNHLLFLINAIYFKGNWTFAFDKKLTKDDVFYLADGSSKTVQMMSLKNARYLLYRDAEITLIDLPYSNKQYSMTLIIPSPNKQLTEILPKLSISALNDWLSKADSSSLDLFMPKFTLEYGINLKETLSAMGMEEAFGGGADFSNMIDGVRSGIAINEVTHKTFVEVNEVGTEAAAVTSIDIVKTSLPPSIRLDRPFFFLIREKSSNTILFVGKLVNP